MPEKDKPELKSFLKDVGDNNPYCMNCRYYMDCLLAKAESCPILSDREAMRRDMESMLSAEMEDHRFRVKELEVLISEQKISDLNLKLSQVEMKIDMQETNFKLVTDQILNNAGNTDVQLTFIPDAKHDCMENPSATIDTLIEWLSNF